MEDLKKLYFFTSTYPFGKGETFIENEIGILSENFESVYIFPNKINGERRVIPSNAEVKNVDDLSTQGSFNEKIKFHYSFLLFSLKEIWKNRISNDSLSYRLAYFKKLYRRFWILQKALKNQDLKGSIFYTYWFEDWATVLSELKRKRIINSFVSRAHGYDIYEERRANAYIPFRTFQLSQVKKVYCASKASMSYLKQKYPWFSSTINYAHLGTMDYGLNPFIPSKRYTIVSCSNIIDIKRVHLIPILLRKTELPIKWIHFGDGKNTHKMKQNLHSENDNFQFELRGRVANQDLMDFYKTTSVDAFIHLSVSEGGVPVSIQEATSFGIPIIATDAGGIAEIVNENTGVLLDIEIDSQNVINEIKDFIINKSGDLEFREVVREFWINNFNAKSNYSSFVHQLLKEM